MLTKVNIKLQKIGGDIMELQKVQRTTLTMKEASEYLGISYWLINQLFRVQALDEYLTKMEQESID